MTHSIQSLKELSDVKLIEQHDELAKSTQVGIDYYLSEIRYREQAKANQEMGKVTKQIFVLTKIVTIATVINLLLFTAQFFLK